MKDKDVEDQYKECVEDFINELNMIKNLWRYIMKMMTENIENTSQMSKDDENWNNELIETKMKNNNHHELRVVEGR